MHAIQTLLFDKDSVWDEKKTPTGSFDNSMRSFVSAEICDLIGLYILTVSYGNCIARHV